MAGACLVEKVAVVLPLLVMTQERKFPAVRAAVG
jgi:hypothetical protein